MNIEQQRKLRNERGSGSSQVQTLRAHQCVCVCLHVIHLHFPCVVFYPMCNFPQSRVVGEALVREAGTSGCLTSQTWCKIHIGIFKCSLILVWAHTLHSYTFIIISVVCKEWFKKSLMLSDKHLSLSKLHPDRSLVCRKQRFSLTFTQFRITS